MLWSLSNCGNDYGDILNLSIERELNLQGTYATSHSVVFFQNNGEKEIGEYYHIVPSIYASTIVDVLAKTSEEKMLQVTRQPDNYKYNFHITS